MEIDQSKLETSSVFCMSPWTHMHFLPDKNVTLCCLSPVENVIGVLDNGTTIKDVWNSEEMRKIRLKMLSGEKSPNHCQRCYEKEQHGFLSLRQHMNQTYFEDHFDIVDVTNTDGSVDELNIIHWDFRFSNVCNQSCRTCGPGFSIKWYNDNAKLYNIPKEERGQKFLKIWDDEKQFVNEFGELFDKVEYIHFAGGEPLITDEHYIALEKLIENNRTDIRIRYSTNFNTLIYKKWDVLEMWKNFSNIELYASIDDVGYRYDYIRNGGLWNKIIKNFKELKKSGMLNRRIFFGIHPTIAFWNIYHLPELFDTCYNAGMFDGRIDDDSNDLTNFFHINPLTYPEHYSCQILPNKYKEKISKKLKQFADRLNNEFGLDNSTVLSLIEYMNEEDHTDLLDKTKDITLKLDQIRKQSFKNTFPFLEDLFDE